MPQNTQVTRTHYGLTCFPRPGCAGNHHNFGYLTFFCSWCCLRWTVMALLLKMCIEMDYKLIYLECVRSSVFNICCSPQSILIDFFLHNFIKILWTLQTSIAEDTIVVSECEPGVDIKFWLKKPLTESCSVGSICSVQLSFELIDNNGPT